MYAHTLSLFYVRFYWLICTHDIWIQVVGKIIVKINENIMFVGKNPVVQGTREDIHRSFLFHTSARSLTHTLTLN